MDIFIKEVFEFLHNNPEPAFEEYKTAEFVAKHLKELGYKVIEKVGKTGVVGILDSGKKGPVLGLRADIDCLQFEVDGEIVNYHGCGHDGNMTMLLAAAKQIIQNGIKEGKLYIIFQPGEETLEGAQGVIESGVIDDIDEIVGIHLQPKAEEEVGHASPRLMHKSYCSIEINVIGRTCHASLPHLGINATEAGALIINAVNTIRSDARSPYSCKATIFKADGASRNSIQDKAFISFDLRAETDDIMMELISKLKNAAIYSAKSVGAEVEIVREVLCYAANYDDELSDIVKEALIDVLGEGKVHDFTPATTSEDFHNYSAKLGAKASYISLGADFHPYLHAYNATFDHSYLEKGAEILTNVAHRRLG